MHLESERAMRVQLLVVGRAENLRLILLVVSTEIQNYAELITLLVVMFGQYCCDVFLISDCCYCINNNKYMMMIMVMMML
jgi:hypothetical protein